jgi:hypothetical protein
MFEEPDRYASIETATLTTPDGRVLRYLRRRFLPQGAGLPLLVEATVAEGDRLDLIAARILGDPLQAWQICDANDAMSPFELTAEPGRTLRVPVPGAQEA